MVMGWPVNRGPVIAWIVALVILVVGGLLAAHLKREHDIEVATDSYMCAMDPSYCHC